MTEAESLHRCRPDGPAARPLRLPPGIAGCLSAGVILLWSTLSCALAQEIPVGFQADRYSRLWQRNPFTLVTPAPAQVKSSAFANLFLLSWLKDGGRNVVFVQNTESNEVQQISVEPNQQNLRLVRLDINANPQFVEALISNGQEQSAVKFRFDAQRLAGQTDSTIGQTQNQAARGQALGSAGPAPQTFPNASEPPRRTLPQVVAHPLYPGLRRVNTEGGSSPATRLGEAQRKRALAGSAAESPAPSQPKAD